MRRQRGFTLIEMIVVIVITGIIAGIVAIFIQAPVQGYIDSSRRAGLTDIADTALRRMARDVRIAVPNSVRTAACPGPCFEFVMTKTGGRYRNDLPGDPLLFDGADTAFDVLHGPEGTPLVAGDFIVIGSSQSDGSVVYDLTGVRSVATYVDPLVTLGAGLANALQMPTHRFDVVDSAVTYDCFGVGMDAGGSGTGELRRYSGYWNFAANRTTFSVPAGGVSAVLADKVSACSISYDLTEARFGLLTIRLTLSEANESVTLHHQMHVNNIP
jgi:MSHA biogenesis protein MshO